MHKHTHTCEICEHDCLHYCSCCNKVYCCKCGVEWGGYNYYWYPYYPYSTPIQVMNWTGTTIFTSISTCSSATDTVTCVHNHNE